MKSAPTPPWKSSSTPSGGAALEQHGGRTPSFKNRRILDLLGNSAPDPAWSLHASFLRMIDFIAGMTDSYATEMAREMTGRSSPQ